MVKIPGKRILRGKKRIMSRPIRKHRKKLKWLNKSDETIFEAVGNRLKYFRKLRGYSSSVEFAKTFDLNRSQYGKCEKGKNIELGSLIRLLRCLNVTIEEFFREF